MVHWLWFNLYQCALCTVRVLTCTVYHLYIYTISINNIMTFLCIFHDIVYSLDRLLLCFQSLAMHSFLFSSLSLHKCRQTLNTSLVPRPFQHQVSHIYCKQLKTGWDYHQAPVHTNLSLVDTSLKMWTRHVMLPSNPHGCSYFQYQVSKQPLTLSSFFDQSVKCFAKMYYNVNA